MDEPKIDDTMGAFAVRPVVAAGRITVQGNFSCSWAKAVSSWSPTSVDSGVATWKEQGRSELCLLPESGEVNIQAQAKPRSGSHHYRARMDVIHTELGFENKPGNMRVWYLFAESKSKSFESDKARLSS